VSGQLYQQMIDGKQDTGYKKPKTNLPQ